MRLFNNSIFGQREGIHQVVWEGADTCGLRQVSVPTIGVTATGI